MKTGPEGQGRAGGGARRVQGERGKRRGQRQRSCALLCVQRMRLSQGRQHNYKNFNDNFFNGVTERA